MGTNGIMLPSSAAHQLLLAALEGPKYNFAVLLPNAVGNNIKMKTSKKHLWGFFSSFFFSLTFFFFYVFKLYHNRGNLNTHRARQPTHTHMHTHTEPRSLITWCPATLIIRGGQASLQERLVF